MMTAGTQRGDDAAAQGGEALLSSWIARGANDFLVAVLSATTTAAAASNDPRRSLGENGDDDVSGTNDVGDMLLLLGISALMALVVSSGALGFMISRAESLVKFSLLFNIGATAVVSGRAPPRRRIVFAFFFSSCFSSVLLSFLCPGCTAHCHPSMPSCLLDLSHNLSLYLSLSLTNEIAT